MRVLLVSTIFQPAWDWGGPIKSTWFLTKGLAGHGINVRVITTNAKQNGVVNVPEERCEEGVKIVTTKVLGNGNWSFANRYGISASIYKKIPNLIKQADIVHINGIWGPLPIISAAASFVARKPFIISPRGNLDSWPLSQKRLKKSLFLWTAARLFLSRASAYHFTSEEELRQAPKWLIGEKGFVLPNPIDIEHKGVGERFRKKINIQDDTILVGMVGRIHKIKGFDIILPAIATFQRKDVVLVMVGPDEGGYKKEAEKAISRLSLTNRVIFAGMLTGQELADAYAGIDILAVPSHHENFGMSAVEALAQGVPAWVSSGVALKDWIEENDMGMVLPLDVHSWAEALAKIEKNEIRKRWSPERLSSVARNSFSINFVAKKMIDQYRRIIAEYAQ